MLEGNALEGKALASLVSGLVAPSISRLEVWLSALPGLQPACSFLREVFFLPHLKELAKCAVIIANVMTNRLPNKVFSVS